MQIVYSIHSDQKKYVQTAAKGINDLNALPDFTGFENKRLSNKILTRIWHSARKYVVYSYRV